ncbi:MAG: putative metallopeptidase [Planctomycetales bacterium]
MPSREAFDFCRAVRRLCKDIVFRLDEFGHVRMDEVAVAFAQARRRVSHGLQARLTPLRFQSGRLTTIRGGRQWTVERLFDGDREMLYILTFYLPRFLDQTFREKLITVVHELYHISPNFDGDIRRLGGRCHVHTHSQKQYDRRMGDLVDRYLAAGPPPELYAFLKKRFRALAAEHGRIVGVRLPVPKLVPLPDSKTA